MDFLSTALLLFGMIFGYNAEPTGSSSFFCKDGEEYDICRSPCQPTCSSIRSGIEIPCNKQCVAGCFCTKGLVRASDNTCVPPEECVKPVCKQNEEFNECGSPCVVNCSNLNDPIFCTKPCYSGCFCQPNFVRDSKGECVPQERCFTAGNWQCAANEQFTDCVSVCNTCWELNYCRTERCRPGCDCKPGLYRNIYGECVTAQQCYRMLHGSRSMCGENEEFAPCVNRCNDCFSRGICRFYQRYCEPGCDCKNGYLRNERGYCVPEESCFTDCNEKEIFLECGPSCRYTCDNYRSLRYHPCLQDCMPGCYCVGNLVLGPDGKCIDLQNCPRVANPGINFQARRGGPEKDIEEESNNSTPSLKSETKNPQHESTEDAMTTSTKVANDANSETTTEATIINFQARRGGPDKDIEEESNNSTPSLKSETKNPQNESSETVMTTSTKMANDAHSETTTEATTRESTIATSVSDVEGNTTVLADITTVNVSSQVPKESNVTELSTSSVMELKESTVTENIDERNITAIAGVTMEIQTSTIFAATATPQP